MIVTKLSSLVVFWQTVGPVLKNYPLNINSKLLTWKQELVLDGRLVLLISGKKDWSYTHYLLKLSDLVFWLALKLSESKVISTSYTQCNGLGHTVGLCSNQSNESIALI